MGTADGAALKRPVVPRDTPLTWTVRARVANGRASGGRWVLAAR
ncbi:hypothetical protein [Streptomyces celluloflavus]|nr:hypothetical protein OG717_00840 [Streptomyces celluloflavus]WSK17143.1 hypothetical protein OG717_38635 [Streptomyces celluloflavus]